MLKWTVNGSSRQTYSSTTTPYKCREADRSGGLHLTPTTPKNDMDYIRKKLQQSVNRQRLKRKSSDLGTISAKKSWIVKENHCTSTPLPATNKRGSIGSRLPTLSNLKDLSNITQESSSSLAEASQVVPKENNLKPSSSTQHRYASTLPTFEVEYSPSSVIPGPILALRGVGIPDSYFQKPRYIQNIVEEIPTKALPILQEEETLETKSISQLHLQKASKSERVTAAITTNSTLSSSNMGDTTLEHMIDAILESARKERKPPKHYNKLQNMSPTYTPADDPASDLQEIWDTKLSCYRPTNPNHRSCLSKKKLFQIKPNSRRSTPLLKTKSTNYPSLAEQFSESRKGKISQSVSKNIRKSNTDLPPKIITRNTSCSKRVCSETSRHNLPKPSPIKEPLKNISPDSGHNSYTDYEDEEEVKNQSDSENISLNVTKRRLSFSL